MPHSLSDYARAASSYEVLCGGPTHRSIFVVLKSPHDQPTSGAATSPVLTKSEIEKIQGLLNPNPADGVTLGLSLLESLGATQADYEAVFTDKVKRAVTRIANKWLQGGEATKAEYVRYHGLLVRPAFLAAWGDDSPSAKPFIDLVEIPAGSFTLGSPKNEPDRRDNEHQVAVRITKPFAIGRTTVTQGQWREVMGTEPWRSGGLDKDQCGDDFPAVFVSWDDAVLFCQTLTGLERETGRLTASQSYRLPTKAEWEYACRAGTTTTYSFGDNPEQLGEYGWFRGSLELHPVAWKKPNPWGLFDMHGNVWEWCSDWNGKELAGGDDPQGPAAGSYRVVRGGGFSDGALYCRSASWHIYKPWDRGVSLGFRVIVL